MWHYNMRASTENHFRSFARGAGTVRGSLKMRKVFPMCLKDGTFIDMGLLSPYATPKS